jgi:hypothetical protein
MQQLDHEAGGEECLKVWLVILYMPQVGVTAVSRNYCVNFSSKGRHKEISLHNSHSPKVAVTIAHQGMSQNGTTRPEDSSRDHVVDRDVERDGDMAPESNRERSADGTGQTTIERDVSEQQAWPWSDHVGPEMPYEQRLFWYAFNMDLQGRKMGSQQEPILLTFQSLQQLNIVRLQNDLNRIRHRVWTQGLREEEAEQLTTMLHQYGEHLMDLSSSIYGQPC